LKTEAKSAKKGVRETGPENALAKGHYKSPDPSKWNAVSENKGGKKRKKGGRAKKFMAKREAGLFFLLGSREKEGQSMFEQVEGKRTIDGRVRQKRWVT